MSPDSELERLIAATRTELARLQPALCTPENAERMEMLLGKLARLNAERTRRLRPFAPHAKRAIRGRKPRDRHDREPPKIPIVDERLRVVGWCEEMPRITGRTLRHKSAEAILGRRVTGLFVEIDDENLARNAGAPPDWRGLWRCIAIGPEMHEPRAERGSADAV